MTSVREMIGLKVDSVVEYDSVAVEFDMLLYQLQLAKPNDHSDKDRAFAIVKTEVEKAYAYYRTYVIDWEPESA